MMKTSTQPDTAASPSPSSNPTGSPTASPSPSSSPANCPSPTVDSSGYINNLIATAIQNGTNSVTLGACQYALASPIKIPAGSNGFVLAGSGSGANGTLITTTTMTLSPSYLGGTSPISIGEQVYGDNWWSIGPKYYTNYALDSIADASNTVTLSGSPASMSYGWYAIYDTNYVENIQDTVIENNHAELVKVTAYNPATGVATLDRNVHRAYGLNGTAVSMSYLDKAIVQNLTIENMAFNGAALDGSGYTINFIQLGVSANVNIHNISIDHYQTEGLSVNLSTGVTISNVAIGDPSATGPGFGYGVYASLSNNLDISQISNPFAGGNQQMVILHTGTTDAFVHDIGDSSTYSVDPSTGRIIGEGLDLHGYDERRITFDHVNVAAINVGNDAWLGGEKDITILNANVGVIDTHPNINGLYIGVTKDGKTTGTVTAGWGNLEGVITFAPVYAVPCSATVTTGCAHTGSDEDATYNGQLDLMEQNIVINNTTINGANSFYKFLGCEPGTNGCIAGETPSLHVSNLAIKNSTLENVNCYSKGVASNSNCWAPAVATMSQTNVQWTIDGSTLFSGWGDGILNFSTTPLAASTSSLVITKTVVGAAGETGPYTQEVPIGAGYQGCVSVNGTVLSGNCP